MWAWALLFLNSQLPQPVSEPDHDPEGTWSHSTSHLPWHSYIKLVTDSGSKEPDETIGQTSHKGFICWLPEKACAGSVLLVVLGHLWRVSGEQKGPCLSISI